MPQRDQLRRAFEALDEDDGVRVIVLRATGENFSSGGYIKGFLEASPEHVSKLAWNIAAPARCAKPVIGALANRAVRTAASTWATSSAAHRAATTRSRRCRVR